MKMREYIQGIFICLVATCGTLSAASAEESTVPVVRASSGAIVGIVMNSAKLAVAGATVTAVRLDGGGIRATVSGSDGVYSFADLAPGAWSVTVQVNGYPDASVPSLQVVASRASRHDVAINIPAAAPAASALAAAQKPAAPAETAAQSETAAPGKPAAIAKSSAPTSS